MGRGSQMLFRGNAKIAEPVTSKETSGDVLQKKAGAADVIITSIR